MDQRHATVPSLGDAADLIDEGACTRIEHWASAAGQACIGVQQALRRDRDPARAPGGPLHAPGARSRRSGALDVSPAGHARAVRQRTDV